MVVSSAFALMEKCPVADLHKGLPAAEIYKLCSDLSTWFDVKRKLNAFAVAANAITSSGAGGNFHLFCWTQWKELFQYRLLVNHD